MPLSDQWDNLDPGDPEHGSRHGAHDRDKKNQKSRPDLRSLGRLCCCFKTASR